MGTEEWPSGQALRQFGNGLPHIGRFAGLVSRSLLRLMTVPAGGSWSTPVLVSTIIMFGTAGSEVSCGVEIHSSARNGLRGSCHRYISCGLTASPAAEVGT